MQRHVASLVIILFGCVATIASAQPTTAPAAPKQQVEQREWIIDGVTRTGLIVSPPADPQRTTKLPVVFAFHGHGGWSAQLRRATDFDTSLPDAIVVYLQGLKTANPRTDPNGERAGWQSRPGEQADRDLKFFDVVWADLKRERPVDADRVFAYGHSNGGLFVFVLWAERANVFRGFATSGSVPLFRKPELTPKRAIHIAGRSDPLAPFAAQERWMLRARQLNGCGPTTEPFAEGGEQWPSATGTPFYAIAYDGGHRPPASSYPLVARFFAETK